MENLNFMENPFSQIYYLLFELRLLVNSRWWRWLSCWFSQSFWIIAWYRIERMMYLLLGKSWSVIRILFLPINFLLRPWFGNCEIYYRASIGKGLKLLHPSLGVVISGNAVIGENLTLVGGNCIGERGRVRLGDLIIGNNVNMGVNSVILGPVNVGNNVSVGAGAVVVKDACDHAILVGVPALDISHHLRENS